MHFKLENPDYFVQNLRKIEPDYEKNQIRISASNKEPLTEAEEKKLQQNKNFELSLNKNEIEKVRNLEKPNSNNKHFFEGKSKVHVGKTVFVRKQNGNKFYQDYYEIWHRSRKYGVMLANSRDKHLMPLDDIQIQISNNKLYEKDWLVDLKQITKAMGATFKNFTRLDIAVDGGSFLYLHKEWYEKRIIKVGRASVNAYYNNKADTTGFYIGMSKSKKRMKCYDKTAELNKSNKNYISKFWKLHGIDTTKKVERMELTMRNEESKKYKDIDWQRLDEPSHLASIMKSNFEKFCDFRIPNGDKNISRLKKVELINWNLFKGEALPKDTTRPTHEIFSAKVSIKKLFEIHIITEEQLYHDIAFEIAINSDLVEWFSKMQEHWTKDLKTKRGHNKDGVISDSWIHGFKKYKQNEQVYIFEHNYEKN